MAKQKMKAITMAFIEPKVDEEGNILHDKKTGEFVYKIVYRKVRHSAAYYPRMCVIKAENPTCQTKGVVSIIKHYSFL